MTHRVTPWIALFLVMSTSGCNVMLYPFARAFGSPPESELAECRRAFSRLKESIRTKALVAFPAFVVSGTEHSWNGDAVAPLVSRLNADLSASVALSKLEPAVPFDPCEGNQLRYSWERARKVGKWVRASQPIGDWFFFTEIWTDPGGTQLHGTYLFVFDGDGKIAYKRLYNSHSFGTNTRETIIDAMAKDLMSALVREPESVFPPYGVG